MVHLTLEHTSLCKCSFIFIFRVQKNYTYDVCHEWICTDVLLLKKHQYFRCDLFLMNTLLVVLSVFLGTLFMFLHNFRGKKIIIFFINKNRYICIFFIIEI